MRRVRQLLFAIGVLAFAATRPAQAQEGESKAPSGLGFGMKGGIGFGPSQFVLGAQYSLGKALGIFRVVPNAHLGIGDDSGVDINVDFLARLIAEDSGFGFYGGLAGGWFSYDKMDDFGLTGVLGTQVPLFKGQATNIEGRIRITEKIPDFRILLTVVF